MGNLIISGEASESIQRLLDELRSQCGSRCVFLSDMEGRIVASSGNPGDIQLETVSVLLGGSITTLIEAGMTLEKDDDAIHLIYRESPHFNLYVVNIGHQLVLIVVNDLGEFTQRIGSVWYAAKRKALELQVLLGKQRRKASEVIDATHFKQMENDLDNLFK